MSKDTIDTSNVTSIVNFDNIDISDIRGAMRVVANIEKQIISLEGGVNAWMMAFGTYVWEEADKISNQALIDLERLLTIEIEFLNSDAAGELKMEKGQVALTGRGAFANAYKKMKNALKKNLVLTDYEHLDALYKECAAMNTAAESAINLAKNEAQMELAARTKVLTIDGLDPDSEEGKKLVDKYVEDMIEKQRLKAVQADVASGKIDATKPGLPIGNKGVAIDTACYVPSWLEEQAAEIAMVAQEVAESAIKLLVEKATHFAGTEKENPKAAADALQQVLESMTSHVKKYNAQELEWHAKSLDKGFLVPEDDAATA